jgi:hypothetical protein
VLRTKCQHSITTKQFISIFIPSGIKAWVVMIKAYLDDTGADGIFVGFGGFAGKSDVWDSIEPTWNERKRFHCIESFHAKEYPELVPDFASLVLNYDLLLLGATVDLKAYKEYAPRKLRNEFAINEFADRAATCAYRIFDWLHGLDAEECALVIDCKSEYEASIADAIYSEAKGRNPYPLHSLTILSEKSKTDSAMREIADLGANLTAKHTAARHYKLRLEKDLSRDFVDIHHSLGINHADKRSIECMADIFTDPEWRSP